MGILSSLMSDSAHYKGIKGRYLMGGALAAGATAYAAGGLTGGWKKEDGSKRSFMDSLGSGAKTLAIGTGIGLGLGAGLMYASNVSSLLSTQKAAGLGFNAKAGMGVVTGAARLTGQQIASTARQYSRLFTDPGVQKIMAEDASKFLADKPHLATKMGRTAEVFKQTGRVVEGVVEHTAGWLSKNWMPHLKGQGSIGDIAGAYVMAGAGVYTGYEAGKHAYEGDLGGAAKAGAMFAAEKYMFMGWKNRGSVINFVKNAKLADYGAIASTGLSIAGTARTAAFEGGVYAANFIKSGVSPTGYLSARGMVLADEGVGLVQHQAVEHLKNINKMSPEYFQKMLNNPEVQETLKYAPKAFHRMKGEAVAAKESFLGMSSDTIASKISAGQTEAVASASKIGKSSFLGAEGAKAYGAMSTEKLTGYATVAQETLGKMEGQFGQLRSQGRSLKMSNDLTTQVEQLHKNFSQVPGFDDAWQKIQGLSHKGVASARRKTGTDFSSPYQGPNTSNKVRRDIEGRDRKMRLARSRSINISRTTHGPGRQDIRNILRGAFPIRQKPLTVIGSNIGIDPRREAIRSDIENFKSEKFQERKRLSAIQGDIASDKFHQQETLSAYRGQKGKFTHIGGPLAAAQAAEKAQLAAEEAQLAKAFSTVTSNKGGFLGQMHSMFGAGGEARTNKMLDTTISHGGNKMTMGEAIARHADDPKELKQLGKVFGNMYSRGTGMFDMGAAGRVLLNMNKSVMSTNLDIAGAAYRGGSAVTKATLGASLGQLGFAGLVVGGVGALAAGAMGITGEDAMGAASAVHEHMKQASKPTYGYSQLGTSTNGLVFGLNARRRG